MEKNEIIAADELVDKIKLKNDSMGKARFYGIVSIISVTGLSAVTAGLVAAYVAKKKNAEFLKELGKKPVVPPGTLESPISLAFRALAWGTVWAVGGCSLIVIGIWKWYGFKNMEDFRTRLGSKIKKGSSDERTEFENLSEFLSYLNEVNAEKVKRKGT